MNNRVLPPPPESSFVSYKNFLIAKTISELMPKKEHCLILDVGCGTGQIDNNLIRDYDANIVGIDYFEEMVEQARSKFKNKKLKFLHADVFKMPFKKNEFDFVLSLGPSAGNLPGAVNKIKKVMKPDGRIYLEYINHFSIYNWVNILTKLKKHLFLFRNALADSKKTQDYSFGAVHYNFGIVGIKKYLRDENNLLILNISYLYSLPAQLNNKSFYSIDRIICQIFGFFMARSIIVEVQI